MTGGKAYAPTVWLLFNYKQTLLLLLMMRLELPHQVKLYFSEYRFTNFLLRLPWAYLPQSHNVINNEYPGLRSISLPPSFLGATMYLLLALVLMSIISLVCLPLTKFWRCKNKN